MSAAPAQFSARNWIASKHHAHLSDAAFEAICNFTLMWNLFEAKVCGRRAGISAFDQLAAQIHIVTLPKGLQTALRFWKNRYCGKKQTNWHFDDLKFRPGDRKAFVAQSLLRKGVSAKDEFIALLIIVFRLRNNLFHGEKAIASLEGQIENLQIASSALAVIADMNLHPLARLK